MKRDFHSIRSPSVRLGAWVWLLLAGGCLLFLLAMVLTVSQVEVIQLAAAATPTVATRTVTFSYDAAGRLVSTNYSGLSLHYQYDASGNLITQTYQSSIYLPVVTKATQ